MQKSWLFQKDDLAVTGQELDAMSDEELDGLLEEISVLMQGFTGKQNTNCEKLAKEGRL